MRSWSQFFMEKWWTKHQILGPTFTMVGTPDYMAPEVREYSWELDCDLYTPPKLNSSPLRNPWLEDDWSFPVLCFGSSFVKLQECMFLLDGVCGIDELYKDWNLMEAENFSVANWCQVIDQTGHTKSVDWWTLGVLLFELLAGGRIPKGKSVARLWFPIFLLSPLGKWFNLTNQ